MRGFEYAEPRSLSEAVSVLAEHKDEDWRVLAGGTDVVVLMQQGKLRPGGLVNIAKIPDLASISVQPDGAVRIGSLVRVRDLELSPEIQARYPIIGQAVRRFGGVTIRNMATVGGNLCRSNPSADLPPVLIVLGAVLHVVGPGGTRHVPVEEFFVGNRKTVLAPDEILAWIEIPPASAGLRGAYYKQSPRFIDLATLGLAVALEADADRVCREVRFALGGAAPTPLRVKSVEDFLRGHVLDAEALAEAGRLAAEDCRPREDSLRATPEFRRRLIRVLTGRVIRAALEA